MTMLITADVPTVSQIIRASVTAPYPSPVLDLDPTVIAELTLQMQATSVADDAPVRLEPTDTEVTDVALRF
jgi:hypothetical protein